MTEAKIITSIKISKKIHQQVMECVISQGYGMRGKNRWIVEATEDFLKMPIVSYAEFTEHACEMTDLNEVISLRLPETLMNTIEKAVVNVRHYYPSMEGVKSNIIRASIIQRLLRKPLSVTENQYN